MLIKFEVENFLSFKNRQQLSMIAAKDDESENTHVLHPEATIPLRLLKHVALFGANASGKSNLLKALFFMKNFVRESPDAERIHRETGFVPFKLSSHTANKPGFFEITFILDKKVYIYGFKLDREKVIKEWLYFYPQKKKVLLFEREIVAEKELKLSALPNEKKYPFNYHFGNYFKGEKQKIISLTRYNSLYLSVGAQFAHPTLERVYKWFNNFLNFDLMSGPGPRLASTLEFLEGNDAHKQKVVSFLKSADLGIWDINIKIEKLDIEKEPWFLQLPQAMKELDGKINVIDISMVHNSIDSEEKFSASIDIDDESLGTKRMFQLAGPFFNTLLTGGILVIDEIEDSLHFYLQKKLLEEFTKHSKNSQVIFTTHNVQLLEEKLFRRDEIWFTEKKLDGSTDLFSLADFKPKPRKDKSIKNGYLTGAYGALPVLGDSLGE